MSSQHVIGWRYYPSEKPDGGYYRATLQVYRLIRKNVADELANEIRHSVWIELGIDSLPFSARQLEYVHAEAPEAEAAESSADAA